jgi:putative peptidoglycan lipid II flippase
MALGTGASRFTGVLRVIALAYALGATRLADGYNLANTAPNMLYDIVIGGVLAATFIPVFVDRLSTRSEREGWEAISAVVTLSVVVLAAATAVFWLAAPLLINGLTALDSTHGTVASLAVTHQREVATSLLRWFVPQVFFYGLIALTTAILNTRRRFVAPMWVPIANNVVCIAVLLWFHHLYGAAPSVGGVAQHHSELLLLGLGTTLGVVAQALLLLPSLRRAHVPLLRPRWDPGNDAVRTIARLGAWTFGFVVANQVALFVVLALAGSASGPAPVSSYTYAYTFMQMPYAVVAVSIMSAVTPDLAERWSSNDLAGFRRRLTGGLRAVLAIIIPSAVGLLLLAKPAAALLLAHGSTTVAGTVQTGAALAMFAIGLPGFCTFLYLVRVLQAMQRTRTAFWLYLVENGINVVLAVALVNPLGVRGLALSLSVAYTAAAVVGVVTLRRWIGPLGTERTWQPLRPVIAASVAMALVVLVVSNASGSTTTSGLLVRVVGAVVCGAAVFAGTAAALGRRAAHIRRQRVFVSGSRDGLPIRPRPRRRQGFDQPSRPPRPPA